MTFAATLRAPSTAGFGLLAAAAEGHEAGEPGHVPTRSFYEAQLFQESSRDYSAIDIILDNIFKIFNFYHQICFIEFYR